MARFNRKGSVTRGGRRRAKQAAVIRLVTEGPHGFAQACQKAGIPGRESTGIRAADCTR